MKNNIIKILTITLIIGSLLTSCAFFETESVDVHMFADLAECEAMTAITLSDPGVTILDSPKEDPYLGDLLYSAFFAFHYASEEFEFKLYAYEFLDSRTAQEYYKSTTGKKSSAAMTFSDVEGTAYFRRIVVMDNCTYAIYTAPSEAERVIRIVNESFTIKLF